MGSIRIAAILYATLLFISWSSQIDSIGVAESSTLLPTTQERDIIARAVNEFGYKLMLKLMKQNGNNNVVISPSGVAGLLAMTLLGSTGTTYDELAKALGFSQDILTNRGNHEVFGKLLQELNNNTQASNESTSINDIPRSVNSSTPSANENTPVGVTATVPAIEDLTSKTMYADAIVVDAKTSIRDVYQDYLKRVYHGEAFVTNFGDTMKSQQLINEWVKNHTSGRIVDFIKEPLPVRTKVVLLSALYFSGQWAQPFLTEFTKKLNFYTPTGIVQADMMLSAGYYDYTYKNGAHMIAFPYNDSSTKMYVLKPAHAQENLTHLLEKFDFSTFERMIDNMTRQECVIRFPRMDLKTEINLKDSLSELGIKSMFSSDANFALMVDNTPVVNKTEETELLTRIYGGYEEGQRLKEKVNSLPNPGMFVDSVLHDVKITIDEYGTVAVAATSGLLSRSAKLFYADSPFYIFIRNEKTKLVTFSAVIFNPNESKDTL